MCFCFFSGFVVHILSLSLKMKLQTTKLEIQFRLVVDSIQMERCNNVM